MTPLPHRYSVHLTNGTNGYAMLVASGLPDLRSAPPLAYDGPGDAWSPEHLLLAAVETCFLFTFRAVVKHAGIECTMSDRSLKHEAWRIAAVDRWSTTRVFAWKNTVALGTTWGDVLAYCAADGALAWTHEVAGTVRAIGGAEDALYIGATDGRIEAVRPPVVCSGQT